MTEHVLQFDDVVKLYRPFRGRPVRALDGFSLTVHRGEIFGFLGPNGAGKTTAIHLAMGFMRATSGTGHMLGAPFGHAHTRRRVGFLAEHVALYHRPASRLVEFYGALNGMRNPSLRARALEMLEAVGLDDARDRNAGKFSRGMLQRVGLAQALVNDPELLVLDEPTSALDPIARVAVRELLVQARRAGKTVFLSSHLLSEIEAVCDRVAIVRNGRVQRIGTTGDLLESHELTEIVARGLSAETAAVLAEQNAAQQSSLIPDGPTGADITITLPTRSARAAVERIWAAGGEVVRLNPVRRSLEEVFLEIATDSPGEDAPDA